MADKKSKSAPSENSSVMDNVTRIWLRIKRLVWDIGGVVLLAVGLMTLMAILMPWLMRGLVIQWWANLLLHWFGWGSIMLVILPSALGLALLRHRSGRPTDIHWKRVFILEATGFGLLVFLTLIGGSQLERAEAGLDGGLVGWGLVELLGFAKAPWIWGTIIGLVVIFGAVSGLGLIRPAWRWLVRVAEGQPKTEDFDVTPAISIAPTKDGDSKSSRGRGGWKPSKRVAPEFKKQFRVDESEVQPVEPRPRDERLPPIKLLLGGKSSRPSERHINQRAGMIEQTLAEFGIPASVIGFEVGPTVTQFAVEPGFIEKPTSADEEARLRKVRVSQIASLSRDLALALSAERLRIEAPVPGRPFVGIEVPNEKSATVRLRPIMESENFYKVGSSLAIALGRDVSGTPIVADLSAMPHLLIAGTTGSGKSVCIAAITTCLVMNNPPEDLRLVMIDPKMVELVRFNGLPHLYGKVETDLERIGGVLRWVVAEMERRYKVLEASRSRNIDTHNQKMRRRKDAEILPRIVVLVDELSDLMMSAPELTEGSLVRLAQMARATGIHLVVATQRPSTDVVTGLIKANFPARMSFATASSVDSRVILDTPGAEHLLGKGDMLFLPPEAGSPYRIQGVYVTDAEIDRVITYWQQNLDQPEEEEYDEDNPPWEQIIEKQEVLADRDELVEKAVDIVRRTQRASTSMLQRRLRVGYPRAARLMDELEELGVVGPNLGGGRERDVLIDRGTDDEEIFFDD